MTPTAYFTTSVPVEIIVAAGYKPVDLNNRFISDHNPLSLVENAESLGFPGSCCAWIKGLYSVILKLDYEKKRTKEDVFIAVTEGDCSNAKVLEEIVSVKTKLKTFLFGYPASRSTHKVNSEMKRLASFLGTTLERSEQIRKDMKPLREKLAQLDRLSYLYPGLITGFENHSWLVSSSDMNGDPEMFQKELDVFLNEVETRKKNWNCPPKVKKIGFLGVPPIIPVHEFIQEKGGVVIFNEIQREFSMTGNHSSLAKQYAQYTYPYSARFRFKKALNEVKKRKIDGIVHYVQSFCHRQIEDMILRDMITEENLNIPVLTIEGDKPLGSIDGRLSTRIEAFLETI